MAHSRPHRSTDPSRASPDLTSAVKTPTASTVTQRRGTTGKHGKQQHHQPQHFSRPTIQYFQLVSFIISASMCALWYQTRCSLRPHVSSSSCLHVVQGTQARSQPCRIASHCIKSSPARGQPPINTPSNEKKRREMLVRLTQSWAAARRERRAPVVPLSSRRLVAQRRLLLASGCGYHHQVSCGLGLPGLAR